MEGSRRRHGSTAEALAFQHSFVLILLAAILVGIAVALEIYA
jgi:hypothetical protein